MAVIFIPENHKLQIIKYLLGFAEAQVIKYFNNFVQSKFILLIIDFASIVGLVLIYL